MAIIMTLLRGNAAVLKKFQSIAIKRILKITNSWPELLNFQNSFLLPLTGTFKNCTITYP